MRGQGGFLEELIPDLPPEGWRQLGEREVMDIFQQWNVF